jgi:hypothetical protein
MTESDGRYGEELRRALSAATDLVEPARDGLERIRARAVHRPQLRAWLTAYALTLPQQISAILRTVTSEIGATTTGHSGLARGLRQARRWPRITIDALRTPGSWLRPVMAATGALLIVLAVTLAIPRLRDSVTQISPSDNSTSGTGSRTGQHGSSTGPGRATTGSGTPVTSGIPPIGVIIPGVPTRCGQSTTSTQSQLGPALGQQVIGLMPGPVSAQEQEFYRYCTQGKGTPSSSPSPSSSYISPSSSPSQTISPPVTSTPTSSSSPSPSSTPTGSPSSQGSATPTGNGSDSPSPGAS